jgi:hypothetical protein
MSDKPKQTTPTPPPKPSVPNTGQGETKSNNLPTFQNPPPPPPPKKKD